LAAVKFWPRARIAGVSHHLRIEKKAISVDDVGC
jgi:hypothetical protein